MTIRSILAAYSGDAQGSSGLRYAILLARAFEAHLTGAVWQGMSALRSRHRQYLTREVIEIIEQRDAETVAAIRADFDARLLAEPEPVPAAFLHVRGEEGFTLADTARGYDLVVMGKRAAESGSEHFTIRPDVLALRSGRPLILVPHEHEPARFNRHVVVAWDGMRAAARALGDAMPIVERAAQVTVVTVGDGSRLPRPAGDDVVTLLRRHGVEATRRIEPHHRGSTAQTLLSVCAEVGADLLVMGAYEHRKFTEDLLGGVTEDIFAETTLPVLMSH